MGARTSNQFMKLRCSKAELRGEASCLRARRRRRAEGRKGGAVDDASVARLADHGDVSIEAVLGDDGRHGGEDEVLARGRLRYQLKACEPSKAEQRRSHMGGEDGKEENVLRDRTLGL